MWMKLLLWTGLVVTLGGAPWTALALGDGADGQFEKRVSSHFVLYQDGIQVTNFEISQVRHSDHLPLVCDFEVA